MPAHRKPSKVLQFTGAFAKNPKRAEARKGEPHDDRELGPPPSFFDEVHASVWREIVDCCPAGVLKKRDRLIVEIITRMLVIGRLRNDLDALNKARISLAELGMTPAAASKVSSANGTNQENSFSDL